MKYILSIVLLGLMAVPTMAQRPERGAHKKQAQRVQSRKSVDKGCPQCVALKKRVEAFKKKRAQASKSSKRGKRGKRANSQRRNAQRRSNSRRSRGRRASGPRRMRRNRASMKCPECTKAKTKAKAKAKAKTKSKGCCTSPGPKKPSILLGRKKKVWKRANRT